VSAFRARTREDIRKGTKSMAWSGRLRGSQGMIMARWLG
jgi:hypothetical protein